MKTKIGERVRFFQRRIGRRLDRENKSRADDGRPVLRGTGAKYQISSRVRATAAGGIALVQRMVQAIGLDREIDQRVDLLKQHQPYHESDHVTNIAYNLLAGGECLEHLELLRNDENYLEMLGARRIPDPTTAGDFCRRFTGSAHVDAIQDAINESRLHVWRAQPAAFFARAMIDADGSVVGTTGDCKEGADFSHKGIFGYHPLVISLANTQEVLYLENRAGSRPSHEGAAARFDQAIALAKRAGFRTTMLRGDTDFKQTKHLDRWDEDGVEFVFGYDSFENLTEVADSLPDAAWSLLERAGYEIKTQPRSRPENVRERIVREREYHNLHLVEEHVAEFPYTPGACSKEYRMVVVRKLITHERGQKMLFPEHRYFFYITNKRDISAREVVRLANTRCDQERLIGQLKSGVRSLHSPVDNLFSNWAYMVCATLAWNLAKWMALLLPESGRWKGKHANEKSTVLRMNFRTFVSAFMLVPAQVVTTGRRVILRMLAWNPWQHVFFRALDSVRAIS